MQLKFRKSILFLVLAVLMSVGCSKTNTNDQALSPTYNPSIIIGSDNTAIFALNLMTGGKNWEFGFYSTIISSPLVYNEFVYIGTSTGDTIYKLNAQTGKLVKKIVTTGGGTITATPIADGRLIYVATTAGNLVAIDTGTYLVAWTYTAGSPLKSSPTVFNGYLYFGCDNGNLYCVDKVSGPTGTYNWVYNPYPSVASEPIVIYSSPAVGILGTRLGDTVVCYGASDSSVYCVSIYDSINHSFYLRTRHRTQGAVNSSPTILANSCIVGCEDDSVYCFDIPSNGERWRVNTNSNVFSSPFVDPVRQVVYVGSNDYYLYAINFIDGDVKWKFRSNGMIKSSPIAYGKYVYVGSSDKTVYAVDTATGTQVWNTVINGNIQCSPVIDNNTGIDYNSTISGYVQ